MGRGRWPVELRDQYFGDVPPSRHLCWAHSARRQTCRTSSRAIHQIRIRHQSANRKNLRPANPAHAVRARRRGDRVKRREFITLLGGAAAAWPLAARAQQPNRRRRPVLGYLVTGTDAGYAFLTTPFLNRLREIGYTDGRNIDIVTRHADADITRLPGLADELVRLKPDVIVAIDPPAACAAKKATTSLPIVAAILNDPVRLGMIASYARPGGNITGILSQVEGLPGKQVEIARELVPGLTVLGVLVNPANATHGYQRQEVE